MSNKGQALDSTEQFDRQTRKNYLFAIAIDRYQHSPPLYNCVRDLERITSILHRDYQFEPAHTFKLYNENATEKGIFKTFKQLVKLIGPEDNLLILYSGHGEYEPDIKEGYWIPVDAQLGEFSDYVSNSRIIKYLQALRAHHIGLIVDSCFSGTLFASRQLDVKTTGLRLDDIPSRWLLTAGRNELVSDGRPGDHSPFADNVIYFLENNRENSLSIAHLSNAVVNAVVYNARQTPRGEPLQQVGHRGGQFFFHKRSGAAPTLENISPLRVREDPEAPSGIIPQPGRTRFRRMTLLAIAALFLLIVGIWIFRLRANRQLNPPAETRKEKPVTSDSLAGQDPPPADTEPDPAPASNPETNDKDQPIANRMDRAWLAATKADSEAAYRRFIERFPKSRWRSEAKQKIAANYRYNLLFTPVLKSGKRLEIHFSQGKAPFDIRIEQPNGSSIEKFWPSNEPFVHDFKTIEKKNSGLSVLKIIVSDHNYKSAGHILPVR